MKVNYRIQRLVIEGASHSDSQRIAEALRGRLSELSAAGLSPRPGSIARLDGGVVSRPASAGQIGRHIAGRIFSSLGGGRRA
jgi:hypothetical protein